MKRQKSYFFKNTVFKKGDETAKTAFSSSNELKVGPAPEFGGSLEMLAASINCCPMTTFEFCANRKGDREYALDK